MEYLIQSHKNDDSRALLKGELDAFLGKNPKKPLNGFIELVKKHEELELCFRGNSNPRITTYSHNNVAFTVLVNGTIEISFNHARYCENWRAFFDTLCQKYNFKGKIENTSSGDITVGMMSRSLKDNLPLSYEQIFSLYADVVKPIFERYFDVEGKEGITDYFKHGKKVKVSGKKEKKRQQEIYRLFKSLRNGYFFYDMEFAQPHNNIEEQRGDDANNKPDMQGIKFDQDGIPDRIVFAEVKCTKDSMEGGSGIIKHLDKMLKYSEDKLVERRKEACDILNQYAQLGLRELSGSDVFQYEIFKDLKPEILLIFTDDAKNIWETDDNYKNVREKTTKVNFDNPDVLVYRYGE